MILQELSEAVGVSGKEDAVRKVILPAIKDHVQDIRIDALGSVTALKPGRKRKGPRVMLSAHMDEVGFMVTGFDGDGSIRFTAIGGVDERILPGLRVKVGDSAIPGVIIWTPIHRNRDQNTVALKNLRIDIGAGSKDEVNGKVKAGDRIAFDSTFMSIGETMLRGKAFDDRVGCSLLVDVLQGGPYPVDVLAAFTVQEEIGLRGARVAAQTMQPDVALALEGTTANDIPNPLAEADDEAENNPACRLGAGPTLTVMDRSLIVNPRLLNFLRQTAERHGIPYQLKTQLGGGTDAGSIHTSGVGVMSGVISVPCRYIHSPHAYLNRDDYANTLKLLQAFLRDLTWDVLKRDANHA
ncbi:MAG: M42 family metallopeptidase [Anaerolineae bacterium]|nr:M42 family metallopeptidase [Anaerolineae bacterium]